MTERVNFCTINTPLGDMLAAAVETGVCGLWFADGRYIPDRSAWKEAPGIPFFKTLREWLAAYFDGKARERPALPLVTTGSRFRETVWKLLLEIPYGAVTTYGALAEKTARLLEKTAMAAQAVGGAVGHNPISIIIPCQRVTGADGSLTGYGGGLERKAALLKLEGNVV